MKKIILIIVFVAVLTELQAQGISGGITGGVSTGSLKITGIGTSSSGVIQGDNIFGIEGGFFVKINLRSLYFKPEAMVLYKCGSVDVLNSELENSSAKKSDFKMNKLEIPMLVGMNVLGPLNLEIGLVYNYVFDITDEFNRYEVDIAKEGIGFRFGANVDLSKRFSFGASYQTITNKELSKATFDSPDELIFGAALAFGSGKKIEPYNK